jgi:hypothetical protein
VNFQTPKFFPFDRQVVDDDFTTSTKNFGPEDKTFEAICRYIRHEQKYPILNNPLPLFPKFQSQGSSNNPKGFHCQAAAEGGGEERDGWPQGHYRKVEAAV